ncbi:putative uncharacterized protein [Blautia hydrogenotrophica CAG:147]|uniref:acyltransferase n=1 Tax=Blautia hydrogenotrophica TaxID=53443 RepID=UPI00033E1A36|nr:acyltransferase [Blautia hydrogenotrophica]CCX59786.1 putative uncharacterized protein [Blautia hydrogenotrophica CAG:147]
MIVNIIVSLLIVIWLLALVNCRLYAGYMKKKDIKRLNAKPIVDRSEVFDNFNDGKKKRNPIKRILSTVRMQCDPYLYGLSRYISICIGKIPSHRIRHFMLKNVLLMQIHPDAIIYGGFEIRSPWNIKLGRVVVGVNALLDGRNGIIMEDDVCLAQEVTIFTEQHDLNDEYFRCNQKGGTVLIKRHAWISSRTTILPKTTIEEGAVLASGAVATKNLLAFGVYGGIPAKKISERNNNLNYELGRVNSFWHFY